MDYTHEDTIGGFHTDEALRRWHTGSIWEVEGQVLYALVRALRPARVLQLGTWRGCGLHHIAAGLAANGAGTVLSVDLSLGALEPLPDALAAHVELREADAFNVLPTLTEGAFDLIFEDMMHSAEEVESVWRAGVSLLAPGGVLISHDSEHAGVGAAVRAGITAAGITDAVSLLIEPSDCGLALWRKGRDERPA